MKYKIRGGNKWNIMAKVNKILSAIPSKEDFIMNKPNLEKIISDKTKRVT